MAEWDGRRIREIWDGLAPAWDRHRDLIWGFTRPISEHLVAGLDPRPGETILEVGTGTGETGFLVAGLLGADGRLIVTDLSPEMVESARTRAEALGIANAEFRTMDVMKLDLPDASVDGIVGRLVYHLVPDPQAALTEARRVLRDGGRISYTVLGPPEELAFDTAVGITMKKLGLSNPPGITIDMELNKAKVIREVTGAAGFGDADVAEVEFRLRFPDGDAAWRYLTELYGRAAALIRGLSPDEQSRFRETFLAELEPFATAAGYDVPGLALNVHAPA